MSVGRLVFHLIATSGLATLAVSPAWAQEPGDQGDDIVVTARRVEERLQDVPISITVYNQEQISNRNILVASDLAAYTPSLTVNQRFGPEKASFTLRGFSQEIGTSPSVGVYFAEVVAPRAAGGTVSGNNVGAGAFMDLQNVQVLKGPQGTLFGRNTTGGAVLLVPQRPTDRLEGHLEGSAGNYDMWRAQGVLNIPLADTFKVRLAVDRNKRDGYMRNRSGIGPDTYNDLNYFAARLSILGELTPDIENYTIASYSNSFSRGSAERLIVCQRDPALRVGGALLTGLAACDQIDRQALRGDGLTDVDIDKTDPFTKIRQWQLINTTTWQMSDAITIRNIASYSEYRENVSASLYGDNFRVTSPFPTAGVKFQYVNINTPPLRGNTVAQSSFTEELQVQGVTSDNRLTWQVGGYLEMSRPIGFSNMFTAILLNCTDARSLQCTNPMGVGFITAASTKHSFDNRALYAQATYNLTDRFSITGGVRYTMDKTTAIGETTRVLFAPGSPTPLLVCDDTIRFNASDGPDADNVPDPLFVSNKSQCHNRIVVKSNRPTWLLGADFKPSENILLYAKYARGYREGGISMTNVGVETWGPEKVDAYEIGAKTTFRGSVSGYFNLALFYNDFRDQQIFGGLEPKVGGSAGGAAIVNAGTSRIQGLEVDGSITLFDRLRVDLGYTYLDTRLKELTVPVLPDTSPFLRINPTAVAGSRLTLSPKNRVTVTATYTLPLDESAGELSIGGTFVHTDKQIANASVPIGTLPATNLINLNVNWDRALGGPFDAAFFVTNVTNEIYPVSVGGSWGSAGFDGYQIGQPRMWGFRLRYRFAE